MFTLSIKTDNAAFTDESARGDETPLHDSARREEVARILREVAKAIANGTTGGPIHDINGNKCGRFDLT